MFLLTFSTYNSNSLNFALTFWPYGSTLAAWKWWVYRVRVKNQRSLNGSNCNRFVSQYNSFDSLNNLYIFSYIRYNIKFILLNVSLISISFLFYFAANHLLCYKLKTQYILYFFKIYFFLTFLPLSYQHSFLVQSLEHNRMVL